MNAPWWELWALLERPDLNILEIHAVAMLLEKVMLHFAAFMRSLHKQCNIAKFRTPDIPSEMLGF
jgi:hypothetical protein